MVRCALACAVAVLLGAAPICSAAAESVRPPLRTLTYAVDLTIVESLDTPGAQISATRPVVVSKGRPSGPRVANQGSGERHAGAGITSQGSITVEVIQATDDAGLVVDIAEDASKRVRPKVRIGITADGTLLYDPANAEKLSEEELAVVRWLGRGFFGDHPTAVGTSWTVDQSSNGRTDIERYRVLAREANQITLGYALEERTAVAGGFAGSREGSLVYDTAMVVPVKVAFDSIARRQVGESYNTLRTSVRLTLTADSFKR